MSMIAQIAMLSLCNECKKHGCIVFSDGSKSRDIRSIEEGLDAVKDALLSKKIIEPEAEYLRVQIRQGNLPSKAAVVLVGVVVKNDDTHHQTQTDCGKTEPRTVEKNPKLH
jgi:Ribonuclease G/E